VSVLETALEHYLDEEMSDEDGLPR